MSLSELNNKYYELFGDLYRNRSLLTERQYEVMSKVLYQQYLEELDVCLMQKLLVDGRSNFELKFKSRMYIPRRKLFGYNKVAKRLLKKYKLEFIEELKRLENEAKEVSSNVISDEDTSELTIAESTALIIAGENTVEPIGESVSDETNG